jgi:hypothetical protein
MRQRSEQNLACQGGRHVDSENVVEAGDHTLHDALEQASILLGSKLEIVFVNHGYCVVQVE